LEKCVYYVFENSEKASNKNEKKMHSPKNMLMQDNYSNSKVIILGAFGGRIDQTLASIHVLYKMYSFFPEKCRENEIILMDDYSLMIFLEPGLNIIKHSLKYESKEGCGLIPIGHKVDKIATSGL
jgi:thiamine pyrophosphokinase